MSTNNTSFQGEIGKIVIWTHLLSGLGPPFKLPFILVSQRGYSDIKNVRHLTITWIIWPSILERSSQPSSLRPSLASLLENILMLRMS